MKEGALDIPKDAKYYSIVSGARCRHKLTNKMNNMSNVKMSNSQINKVVDELSIRLLVNVNFKRSKGRLQSESATQIRRS